MISALIVDDEPLARADLRQQLQSQGVIVLAEAETAAAGLEMAESLRPDVVLLDIRMPGLSGLEMSTALVHLANPPALVFVTGFTDHALEAFDRDAVDYLVKPVQPDRLARALLRVRKHVAERVGAESANTAAEVPPADPPMTRLPIRGDFAVRLVDFGDIQYAEAREKRVYIHAVGEAHRTSYTLKQLEKLLPPDQFVRVHESYLVSIARVREVLLLGDHAYEVRLDDGSRVPVSRTRYADLQRRLGLVPPL